MFPALLEHLHKILPKPQVSTSLMEIVQWCKGHFLSCLCLFLRRRGGLVQTCAVPLVSSPAQPPPSPPKMDQANAWSRAAILKRELRLGCGAWSDSCALIQHWVSCCRTDFSITKREDWASLRAPDTSLNCLMGELGFGSFHWKVTGLKLWGCWFFGGHESRGFNFSKPFFFLTSLLMTNESCPQFSHPGFHFLPLKLSEGSCWVCSIAWAT